jgi:O-antigen ligase
MAARRRWLDAALLALAVAVTVTEFNSRASILVLVAVFGAPAVAARLPRVVAVGMIGAVVLIAFVFPLVAPDEAAIERVGASLPQLPPSAGHRLVIWRFVADKE